MSTTTLFVEILIVGLEALVWLAMIAGILFDFEPILNFLQNHNAYSAFIATFLLAIAYAAGIIIDRVADSLFNSFPKKAKKPKQPSFRKMRLRVMHSSDGMAKFIEYQRSRLRIARATVFNLLITVFVAVIWVWNVGEAAIVGIPTVVGVGAAAIAVSGYGAYRINKAQSQNTVEAYRIITEDA